MLKRARWQFLDTGVLWQVKLLEFHPVQPWLAFCDTNQLVTVWNWATEQVRVKALAVPQQVLKASFGQDQSLREAPSYDTAADFQAAQRDLMLQVVCEFALPAAEEVALQDALLRTIAERDPQFYGQPVTDAPSPGKSAAPGAIKALSFLDLETCYWQLGWQHFQLLKAYSSSGIPHVGAATQPSAAMYVMQ